MKQLIRKSLFFILKRFYKIFSGYGLGNLVILNKFFDYFRSEIGPTIVEKYDNKFFLPKNDPHKLALDEEYEPEIRKVAENFIEKGDTVIDVGAFIGYHSLFFSSLVGADGEVLAFEPDPRNFDLLKKNIDINNVENILAFNKGLGAREGETCLYRDLNNEARTTLSSKVSRASNHKRDKSVKVNVISLDDFLSMHKYNPDFIKMDAEGFEYEVFEGMTKTLCNTKNIEVVFEYTPEWLDEKPYSGNNKFETLLEEYFENVFYVKNIKNSQFNQSDFIKGNLIEIDGFTITDFLVQNEMMQGNFLVTK